MIKTKVYFKFKFKRLNTNSIDDTTGEMFIHINIEEAPTLDFDLEYDVKLKIKDYLLNNLSNNGKLENIKIEILGLEQKGFMF